VIPDFGETAYSLVRAGGLVAALGLALALERWRPHEGLRPAWRTNGGLWAVDAVVTTAVCGACARQAPSRLPDR